MPAKPSNRKPKRPYRRETTPLIKEPTRPILGTQNRYWLFGGDRCINPIGGMSDFVASYEKIESARQYVKRRMPQVDYWHQIYDTKTSNIV